MTVAEGGGGRTSEKSGGDGATPASTSTGGGGGGGGGAVVVVGVKLGSKSRELLTWAMVKVARPGDRVIALHVLHPDTEGKSTVLSVVKAFNSLLAAYEGLCSLKQVELKLKIFKGSSVSKVLAREATFFSANGLIVGTSVARYTIRSSVSVAKHCARKLPKSCSVLAVDDGKILFQKGTAISIINDSRDSHQSRKDMCSTHQLSSTRIRGLNNTTIDKAAKHCPRMKVSMEISESVATESELPKDFRSWSSSTDFVPVKNRKCPEKKPGCAMLRWIFLHKQKPTAKHSVKNNSFIRLVLKLPSRRSLLAAFPYHKQRKYDKELCESSESAEDNIAISPVGIEGASFSPSPACHMKYFCIEPECFQEKYSSICRLFSYQELRLATSNFPPDNRIGKGGSSQVYRGCLPDGKEIAVKLLRPSDGRFKQFVSEIEIITNLRHENIISLFGFCSEHNNMFLVYEYLSRGSLEDNLHGKCKNGNSFGWEGRYKVALGVATALNYLHNGAAESIIHRDVKSSNILLSDDFEPQLSDFGIAVRSPSSSNSTSCTELAGTIGYLAPEYFMHGKVTEKIDVYAYGVVLLELLSGRMPVNNGSPKGQESLVMWAQQFLKSENFSHLLDSSLDGEHHHVHIENMVLAARLCIISSPQMRPGISLILKLLKGDREAIEWARQQLSASSEELDLDCVNSEKSPKIIQSILNSALSDTVDISFSVAASDHSI